jgi:hypothetical protein
MEKSKKSPAMVNMAQIVPDVPQVLGRIAAHGSKPEGNIQVA